MAELLSRQDPAADAGSRVTRLTVNLRPRDADRLEEIAKSTNLNKNEIVRRALATEAFMQRTLAEGRKILVEDSAGAVREVEFLS